MNTQFARDKDTMLDVYMTEKQRQALARIVQGCSLGMAELKDLHDHIIDIGHHDCDGIPGGCPVLQRLSYDQPDGKGIHG